MNVIVDIQGFKNEQNKFIPKEIAILCNESILVLLIKPPYPYYDLTQTERRQVGWIEKNRGILWNEGFVPYYHYTCIIQGFFKHKRIFTKGLEKVTWLKEILETDEVYNLEDFKCPNLETLLKQYSTTAKIHRCIFHNNVCALKYASCLKMWCQENNVLCE